MIQDALSTITSLVSTLAYAVVMLTEPPNEVSINFKLHTADFTSEFTLLNETEYSFKPDDEVKILCHDWENLDNIAWYDYMIEEYRKRGEHTIITADYSSVFKNATLEESYLYIKPLGKALGDYIIKLNELGVPFEKIHVIAHRLGAHVAGAAGERVYEITGENIDRITGLDPSETGVFEIFPDGSLSRDDAKFVDIIHAAYASHWLGMGRVDFHVNSLAYFCDYYAYNNITDVGPRLYSMTIGAKNSKMFKFERCDDLYPYCQVNLSAYMGEYTNRKTFGVFLMEMKNVPLCKILNVPFAPTYD